MVAARLLEPASKLATTRWWQVTTLPAELGVEEADEEDLYAALDWFSATPGADREKARCSTPA